MERGPGWTGDRRPGTLIVLEPPDGPTVGPQEGRVLWFGRNRMDVHICIGSDDRYVSRRHGTLEFSGGRWWVRTWGSRPVHVGGTRKVWRGDEPVALEEGRTSLLVEGKNPHDPHRVRVEVVGAAEQPRRDVQSGTVPVPCFKLEPTERLVMTVLAQRYLLREPDPQPLTAREAAVELCPLQPAVEWTQKKVEHLVKKVRDRLTAQGVDGLVPEPGRTGFDSAFRRNLIEVLLASGTIDAADLALLGLD